MTDLGRDEWRAIWRELAQRNNWELVQATDEDAFLDDVVAEWSHLHVQRAFDRSPWRAILSVYSKLRFHCFCAHSNQATEEIRTAVFRIALRRGWSHYDAEDLAQETTERMYRARYKVDQPEALNGWMYRVFQTVQRDYLRHMTRETPIHLDEEGKQLEIPDEAQNLDRVEQSVLNDTIAAHIRAAIPNTIERIVLLRILFWNEHPRDIAHDLGLDLTYTRVIKYRVTQRLRQDEGFKTLIRELLNRTNLEPPPTGEGSHEAQINH